MLLAAIVDLLLISERISTTNSRFVPQGLFAVFRICPGILRQVRLIMQKSPEINQYQRQCPSGLLKSKVQTI